MVGAGPALCKIHCVALSTLFQVLPRAIVSIVVQFQWRPAQRRGLFKEWGRLFCILGVGKTMEVGGGGVSSSAIGVLSC